MIVIVTRILCLHQDHLIDEYVSVSFCIICVHKVATHTDAGTTFRAETWPQFCGPGQTYCCRRLLLSLLLADALFTFSHNFYVPTGSK